MNKQQYERYKSIIENAPEDSTDWIDSAYADWNCGYPTNLERNEMLDLVDFKDAEVINLDMANQIITLYEENEKLKARVLTAENILYQLVEEQGLCCSEFGNLLPVEDQDSEVIRKAINFMNSHIQKLKELSND